MRTLVIHISKYMLLGAIVGAVAGLITSDFMPDGAVGGAAIGAIIGAYLGTRIKAYRAASASAVRHHIEGTRSIGPARDDLIRAARLDKYHPGGKHTGTDANRREN